MLSCLLSLPGPVQLPCANIIMNEKQLDGVDDRFMYIYLPVLTTVCITYFRCLAERLQKLSIGVHLHNNYYLQNISVIIASSLGAICRPTRRLCCVSFYSKLPKVKDPFEKISSGGKTKGEPVSIFITIARRTSAIFCKRQEDQLYNGTVPTTFE